MGEVRFPRGAAGGCCKLYTYASVYSNDASNPLVLSSCGSGVGLKTFVHFAKKQGPKKCQSTSIGHVVRCLHRGHSGAPGLVCPSSRSSLPLACVKYFFIEEGRLRYPISVRGWTLKHSGPALKTNGSGQTSPWTRNEWLGLSFFLDLKQTTRAKPRPEPEANPWRCSLARATTAAKNICGLTGSWGHRVSAIRGALRSRGC